MSEDNSLEQKAISGLLEKVSDWYLPSSDPIAGFAYPGPITIKDHQLLYTPVSKLFSLCEAVLKKEERKTHGQVEKDDFVVKFDKFSYRMHVIRDSIDGPVFTLRKSPDYIPSVKKLGMPNGIHDILLHQKLSSGGLIFISGETGNGKSTTCAAVVKERLEKFGSFCLTIEDPPEMPLHGVHQLGRCIQTEVSGGDWGGAMKAAMRCYPSTSGSMLYVGETRDPIVAAETLKIATNGHLVLTTLHAENLENAIRRFISLASSKGGMDRAEVNQTLASVFRLGIHQKLMRNPSNNERRLEASFLFSPNNRSPVGQKLKKDESSFNNEIQLQETKLSSRGVNAILEDWK